MVENGESMNQLKRFGHKAKALSRSLKFTFTYTAISSEIYLHILKVIKKLTKIYKSIRRGLEIDLVLLRTAYHADIILNVEIDSRLK